MVIVTMNSVSTTSSTGSGCRKPDSALYHTKVHQKGTLTEWLVRVGQAVEKNQKLGSFSATDPLAPRPVATDILAAVEGKVKAILTPPGQHVSPGDTVLTLSFDDSTQVVFCMPFAVKSAFFHVFVRYWRSCHSISVSELIMLQACDQKVENQFYVECARAAPGTQATKHETAAELFSEVGF